jgi:hypothetical protein
VTKVRPLETLQAMPIFVVVLYKYYIHESIPRCHRQVSKNLITQDENCATNAAAILVTPEFLSPTPTAT